MNMYIWDKYDQQIINTNLRYFFDIWEDICMNIENPTIDFDLSSPHYILIELLDELLFNKLNNQENKKYYIGLINRFYSNDNAITGKFKVSLRILRQEIQKPRYLILQELIKNAILEAQNGVYFFELHKLLKHMVLEEKDFEASQEKIKYYTKNLVIELLLRGYSIKTIKEIPENVFDWYNIDNGLIYTKYPHSIKYKECIDKDDYNCKVKVKIDNLSIDERFEKIKEYFSSKNNDYYYIFNIEGLSGDKEYKIENVVLYNPYKKHFIKKEEFARDYENFGIAEADYGMNAITKVQCVDYNNGIKDALDQINCVLDIIRRHYRPKANFIINAKFYKILNDEYDLVFETIGSKKFSRPNIFEYLRVDKENESFMDYLNSTMEVLNKMQHVYETKKTLRNVLHYYRKADESTSYEDKILDYWIALETIFNEIENEKIIGDSIRKGKFNAMVEIIPNILLSNYIYHYGWNSFNYIDNLINSKHGFKKCLDLPEELKERVGMKSEPGTKIYLKDYISNIEEIIQIVDRTIIKEKLTETDKFFCDNAYARKKLDSMHDMLKDELLMLYRIRNKIVHDAYYTGAFVEYSSIKLRYILNTILGEIFLKDRMNKSSSIQETLVSDYVAYENIIMSLDSNKNTNLLGIVFDE